MAYLPALTLAVQQMASGWCAPHSPPHKTLEASIALPQSTCRSQLLAYQHHLHLHLQPLLHLRSILQAMFLQAMFLPALLALLSQEKHSYQ
jgi:hypothetical protein